MLVGFQKVSNFRVRSFISGALLHEEGIE